MKSTTTTSPIATEAGTSSHASGNLSRILYPLLHNSHCLIDAHSHEKLSSSIIHRSQYQYQCMPNDKTSHSSGENSPTTINTFQHAKKKIGLLMMNDRTTRPMMKMNSENTDENDERQWSISFEQLSRDLFNSSLASMDHGNTTNNNNEQKQRFEAQRRKISSTITLQHVDNLYDRLVLLMNRTRRWNHHVFHLFLNEVIMECFRIVESCDEERHCRLRHHQNNKVGLCFEMNAPLSLHMHELCSSEQHHDGCTTMTSNSAKMTVHGEVDFVYYRGENKGSSDTADMGVNGHGNASQVPLGVIQVSDRVESPVVSTSHFEQLQMKLYLHLMALWDQRLTYHTVNEATDFVWGVLVYGNSYHFYVLDSKHFQLERIYSSGVTVDFHGTEEIQTKRELKYLISAISTIFGSNNNT